MKKILAALMLLATTSFAQLIPFSSLNTNDFDYSNKANVRSRSSPTNGVTGPQAIVISQNMMSTNRATGATNDQNGNNIVTTYQTITSATSSTNTLLGWIQGAFTSITRFVNGTNDLATWANATFATVGGAPMSMDNVTNSVQFPNGFDDETAQLVVYSPVADKLVKLIRTEGVPIDLGDVKLNAQGSIGGFSGNFDGNGSGITNLVPNAASSSNTNFVGVTSTGAMVAVPWSTLPSGGGSGSTNGLTVDAGVGYPWTDGNRTNLHVSSNFRINPDVLLNQRF